MYKRIRSPSFAISRIVGSSGTNRSRARWRSFAASLAMVARLCEISRARGDNRYPLIRGSVYRGLISGRRARNRPYFANASKTLSLFLARPPPPSLAPIGRRIGNTRQSTYPLERPRIARGVKEKWWKRNSPTVVPEHRCSSEQEAARARPIGNSRAR